MCWLCIALMCGVKVTVWLINLLVNVPSNTIGRTCYLTYYLHFKCYILMARQPLLTQTEVGGENVAR